MLKDKDWKGAAELIGIAAIVASLIFVAVEIQQSRDIAFGEAVMTIYANKIETRSHQNENVDIWLRGNSGLELSDNEASIYRNLVTNRIDEGVFNAFQNRQVGIADDVARNDLAVFLFKNRGARLEWELFVQNREKYHERLSEGSQESGEAPLTQFFDSVSAALTKLDNFENGESPKNEQ